MSPDFLFKYRPAVTKKEIQQQNGATPHTNQQPAQVYSSSSMPCTIASLTQIQLSAEKQVQWKFHVITITLPFQSGTFIWLHKSLQLKLY